MDTSHLLIPAAFALDLVLGDPHRWPHPVRLIGVALTKLEPAGQALPRSFRRAYGLAVAALLGLAAYATVALLISIPGIGWFLGIYFAYSGLALGQLLREARHVSRLIRSGDLDAARVALSFLVSRDTSALDEPDLWRTLAETVSENFCDAFVAPMFYLALGGPALLWFYKTVSTMDSMWGYKTRRFVDLGWAGARADDLLAWMPARLSALLLIAAGFLMGLHARDACRHVAADAAKMSSPNAGWPMAAAAWLCGRRMGGPATYFGEAVMKPVLGGDTANWACQDVESLLRLILLSGFGMLFLSVILHYTSVAFFS